MNNSTAITSRLKFALRETGIVNCLISSVIQDKVCNMDYLIAITRGNKISMNNIVEVFFKETKAELLFLTEAINKTNYTIISDIAHKLKSAFAILGINSLNQVFREMELLSSSKSNIERITQLNHCVNIVFDQAMEELKFTP